MTKFWDRGNTRVAILSSVASLSGPTVAELNGGTNITPEVLPDGVPIQHTTVTADRTKWKGDALIEVPTKYATSMLVRGYRHKESASDVLWNLAVNFRAIGYLVIRRGVPYATAWTAAQRIEVYRFRWGKRSSDPTVDASTFFVPMYVQAEDDDAVVVA